MGTTSIPRNPDQIERAAEIDMDLYDRQVLRGLITQAEYDTKVKALDARTRRQHAEWQRHATIANWPKMEG